MTNSIVKAPNEIVALIGDRYDPVAHAWSLVERPPITRAEADRAQRNILRRFGRCKDFPAQKRNVSPERIRKCWISSQANPGLSRGWERLVHDISHRIFAKRYPQFRPHHPLHSKLELEITDFVISAGWLTGSLKAKQKSATELRADKRRRVCASIVRWESKWRRADNALKKLRRSLSKLERL